MIQKGSTSHLSLNMSSCVAQSVARLTHEPEVAGSIPGPTILLFLLLLIQEGQLSVTEESM